MYNHLDMGEKTVKVLIVDDAPDLAMFLKAIIASEQYHCVIANSGIDAVQMLESGEFQPDLILLDIIMPEMDGIETCQKIKQMEDFADIPIIFTTGCVDDENIVNAFEAGGVDYITKPIRKQEVLCRIKIHTQLKQLMDKLREMAEFDELSKLYTRRVILHFLQEQLAYIKRYPQPCSVILFDIDHFKKINDTLGHIKGDQVIQAVAELTRGVIRDIDKCGRYGGEEFLIVLPKTDLQGAKQLAERLHQEINQHNFALDDNEKLQVTCSFGVTQINTEEDLQEVINRADVALYKAKELGRNKIITADQDQKLSE